ncbi:MAG TPA: porin family protein [Cellvibrio sp.]|nr:porin family protein [Cellvibrio sp.]
MKKQLLAAALLTSVTVPAMASDFYLVADLGKAELDIQVEDGYSKSDTAFSLGGGYKFNETFALEVVYRDLLGFNTQQTDDLEDGDYLNIKSDTSVTSIQASVVAQFPLNEAFALYGRLGAGSIKLETDYVFDAVVFGERDSGSNTVSNSKTKVVIGVGVKYALNESVALRAEYNQYDKWEDIKISSATVGLTYQF